jgi:hypothetical protein
MARRDFYKAVTNINYVPISCSREKNTGDSTPHGSELMAYNFAWVAMFEMLSKTPSALATASSAIP